MKLVTENFLLAISIFFIGTLLSIIISKLSKIFLKRFPKEQKQILMILFLRYLWNYKTYRFLLSFYFSIDYFFADEITFISVLLNILKLFILIIIIKALNKVLIRSLTESTSKINDSSISSMISSLTPLIKALTWTIGSIFFLQNIGVQMTAIWALLSAGGIGAGLALKDPVQEFFEYITILLDKPFQKGEFIKSDGVLGMVERVEYDHQG